MLYLVVVLLCILTSSYSTNRNSARLLQQQLVSTPDDIRNHTHKQSPQNTSNVLVIVLGETRAYELTFDSFKKNLIDELNADLCLCIGVNSKYDYSNPFFKLAKYRFLYNEPDDYATAFDYASDIMSKNKYRYEKLLNVNGMYEKLPTGPKTSNDNIEFYGTISDFDHLGFYTGLHIGSRNDDAVVFFTKDFEDEAWRNQVYGIRRSYNDSTTLVSQKNVITYKKPLHWREFLKIPMQFLGGIKDDRYQHPGSAGILIFYRWFLLKNLRENGLMAKYDRFIITRSDFIYQMPHPSLSTVLTNDYMWVPDREYYWGITDRHTVLTRNNVHNYLDILNGMVMNSNDYFRRLNNTRRYNLEMLIDFHVSDYHSTPYKFFPYIMYTARPVNGTTRWSNGTYSQSLGYYIKYDSEYRESSYYYNLHAKLSIPYDDFYNRCKENKC